MKNQVRYDLHLVILMDLLGQKEMYKTLENFEDPTGEREHEFREKLIQFIRMIENFKKDVDLFLVSSNEYESQIDWPEHAQEFVTKTRKELCKIQRFSDGIMVFVPLGDSADSFPISSVFTALVCSASTMLNSLARKNPIRAGIGIGGGAEIDEGELFGPAIGYAHEMENERAIYPRIAIHEKLVEYLDSYIKPQNANDIEHNFVFQMSQICKSIIKLDEDGEYILDYLNDAIWKSSFQGDDGKLLRLAFDFIKAEKLRFETENNEKLALKYSYLYKYFVNTRKELH